MSFVVFLCVAAGKNYLVFGHDHIGHGESDGKRAYIENVDHYVDDLIEHSMLVKVRTEEFCVPVSDF